MAESINTFWNLINNHRIEIPMIQRDYAQGRKDVKASQIRKKFLEQIFQSLENREPLHLDFIYGKIDGKIDSFKVEANKRAILGLLKSVQDYSDNLNISFEYDLKAQNSQESNESNTNFIPLDGQQRLTTLYLLHWYLSMRLEYTVGEELIKFTYKTRRSSQQFCENLITKKLHYSFDKKLSIYITDNSWFYDQWKYDPTVQSMLVMIDDIHEYLKDTELSLLESYWDKLTSSDLISFEFLDLDKFELTDDLYVKMNARGKVLSEFENFKSWLIDYIDKNKIKIYKGDWQINLDIKWSDAFWKNKDEGSYEIDSQYLGFFKLLLTYVYIESLPSTTGRISEDIRINIDKIKSGEQSPKSLIDDEIFNLEESGINSIFKAIDIISTYSESIDETISELICEVFNNPLNQILQVGNNTRNYWDSTYCYAVIKFLIEAPNTFEENKNYFKQYVRIVRNLIYNSAIDSPTDFVNAIHRIRNLIENYDYKSSFYFYYSQIEPNKIGFFSKNQTSEEQLKSELINENKDWENEFIIYENHTYFYGQIGFLLKMCKYQNNNYKIDKFRDYASKCSELFKDKILENEKYIVQRALLTKGDYTIHKVGPNNNFCLTSKGTVRLREENWRKIFNNEPTLEILQNLLDYINKADIIKSLELIIKQSEVDKDDWRYYVINEPKVINYMSKMLFRKWGEHNVYLLSSSGGCYNVELHSYFLYLKEKENVIYETINYEQIRGLSNNEPCLYGNILRESGNSSVGFLCYKDFEDGKYVFVISTPNKKGVKDYIDKNNITKNEDGEYERRINSYTEYKKIVKEISEL